MKSKMLMMVGVAGMLMSNPATEALAEVSVRIGAASRPAFVIDRPPTFVRLATPGFSVSVGAPYDIVRSGNFYYLHDQGQWYRSARYNGPWRNVSGRQLPRQIRRYRIEQIRNMRDDEYRVYRNRHDNSRRDDRRYGPGNGPGRPR
ncbi:MAG: hypothetical protein HGA97_07450 [Chlorobiaceae bacterium]|nr:hypothetical protein [Chlorobiaceae bacterium]